MQLSLTAIVLGLAALASAMPQDERAVMARQNANRPVPSGTCCVANTSLKQDACTAANGQAGRCVPGGNNCGGALSCVQQSNLVCNNVVERGKSLCRAKAPGGGLFDGARIIQSLGQAKVN
ncbi:uncharacterized protein B0T15DRAFT_421252 [Chaetomium strumarium]|uniref:Uncharacterized protein n=1 Tax=Chaetomium strumarium TaxID=1170767 RepID=A0AAJ0GPH7_9PEZI|nr:hypothetical protein B0T15DRAFT_421252 [Chaetomium strumarium]